MPRIAKSADQKATDALESILRKRGIFRGSESKYLAEKFGVCLETGRKIFNNPSRMTVGQIRILHLSDEEIRGIIG